jgi:N utilization substance protein B
MEAIAEGLSEDQDTPSKELAARPSRGRLYDHQLFDSLLRGVPDKADEIDSALRGNLDRSLQSLDPVERSILRIGTYELLFSFELPARVVINESVELAKAFGAEQGHRYVNAVLDRVARTARTDELARKTPA